MDTKILYVTMMVLVKIFFVVRTKEEVIITDIIVVTVVVIVNSSWFCHTRQKEPRSPLLRCSGKFEPRILDNVTVKNVRKKLVGGLINYLSLTSG